MIKDMNAIPTATPDTQEIARLVGAKRPRRLRHSPALRTMVRETALDPADFIYPLFVVHGDDVRTPIASMPGIAQLSVDQAVAEARTAWSLGVQAVILFGIPEVKDPIGLENFAPDGIVQRATGEMPGARLRAIAGPLGADVWFGAPRTHRDRCADVIWDPSRPMPTEVDPDDVDGETKMVLLGYFNLPGYSSNGVVNTPEWRDAEVPSTNGHGSARGVATMYAALLEPGRVLSPDLLAEATRAQSTGWCPVLGEDTAFGLGFKPTLAHRPFGPNPRSFGHFGTGGAVGFGDPVGGVAFGYVMNHVIPRWQSTRNRSLIDAVYASL